MQRTGRMILTGNNDNPLEPPFSLNALLGYFTPCQLLQVHVVSLRLKRTKKYS